MSQGIPYRRCQGSPFPNGSYISDAMLSPGPEVPFLFAYGLSGMPDGQDWEDTELRAGQRLDIQAVIIRGKHFFFRVTEPGELARVEPGRIYPAVQRDVLIPDLEIVGIRDEGTAQNKGPFGMIGDYPIIVNEGRRPVLGARAPVLILREYLKHAIAQGL